MVNRMMTDEKDITRTMSDAEYGKYLINKSLFWGAKIIPKKCLPILFISLHGMTS